MATVQPPAFLQGGTITHPAVLFRRAMHSAIHREGIAHLNNGLDMQVTPGGGMNVAVASGGAHIQSDILTHGGMYFAYNDASVTLAVAAAHATFARKDLVVARIKDNVDEGVAGDTWTLEIITGTASGSPVEPTLPGSALKLAVLSIPAALGTIAASHIFDTRQFANYDGRVNVLWFGADPSGATNSTPAFQAAIDYLKSVQRYNPANNAATGGVIFVPTGTYKLDGQLVLDDLANILIVGESQPTAGAGLPTRLSFTITGSTTAISARSTTGVCFKNLYITTTQAAWTGIFISYAHSTTGGDASYGYVEDCAFDSTAAKAAVYYDKAIICGVTRCNFMGGQSGVWGRDGIGSYSNVIFVVYCNFQTQSTKGIVNPGGQTWKIMNCTFEPMSTGAVNGIKITDTDSATECNIDNCWFGDAASGTCLDDMRLVDSNISNCYFGSGDRSIDILSCTNLTIMSCTIGGDVDGIVFATSGCTAVTVFNCRVTNAITMLTNHGNISGFIALNNIGVANTINNVSGLPLSLTNGLTMTGTLKVTGLFDHIGDLSTVGNATITGNITVNGLGTNTLLGTLNSAGNAIIGGQMRIAGGGVASDGQPTHQTLFGGGSTGVSVGGTTFAGGVLFGNNTGFVWGLIRKTDTVTLMYVKDDGAMELLGGMNIGGGATFGGVLTTGGVIDVNGAGLSSIAGGLEVLNQLRVDGSIASDGVLGLATYVGDGTKDALTFAGGVMFGDGTGYHWGMFRKSDGVRLFSFSDSGGFYMLGTANITGNVFVTGSIDTNANLDVAGTTTLTGGVEISNNITQTGTGLNTFSRETIFSSNLHLRGGGIASDGEFHKTTVAGGVTIGSVLHSNIFLFGNNTGYRSTFMRKNDSLELMSVVDGAPDSNTVLLLGWQEAGVGFRLARVKVAGTSTMGGGRGLYVDN